MKTMQHLALAAALVAVIVGASQAATPPDRINYQGVLRDSDDRPYNGEFGMIFRFFSDELAGDEILLDDHIATPVMVTGGLFNVALGSGEVFDGLGPGAYTSLAEVFRDYEAVWLEVEIEGETLTPRLRVISAAYALNAEHLDGKTSADFLDVSSTPQAKAGTLTLSPGAGHALITASGNVGIGETDPAADLDLRSSGPGLLFRTKASTGLGSSSLFEQGVDHSITFQLGDPTSGATQVLLSPTGTSFLSGGNVGIGTNAPDQTLHVHKGSAGAVNANSNSIGVFENSFNGYLSILTPAESERGFLFGEPGNSVAGGIVYNNSLTPDGLQFRTNGNVTRMVLDGVGNVGIGTMTPNEKLTVAGTVEATSGGFKFPDGTTQTTKAAGDGHSLDASDGSQVDVVFVSDTGDVGIGTTAPVSSVYPSLTVGAAPPGFGSRLSGPSIIVGGGDAGNKTIFFTDSQFGMSVGLGTGGLGVIDVHFGSLVLMGHGSDGNVGIGEFDPTHRLTVHSQDDNTLRLIGPDGLLGHGARLNFGDGDFAYIDEPTDDALEIHARHGVTVTGNFTVTGAKNFVQPHPLDPSKEIVFTSLEGNESGTYFRGSARLSGGTTVIEVPEEFRLVSEAAGLSVQLTPRGPDAGLWVDSADFQQIVVRGSGDAEFDYLVNGVRRGFANRERIRENRSFVPQVRGVPYSAHHPEGLQKILVENGTLNPDYTPNEETAAKMGWTLREPDEEELSRLEKPKGRDGLQRELPDEISRDAGPTARPGRSEEDAEEQAIVEQPGSTARQSIRPSSSDHAEYFLVHEPVEVGDVLAVDLESPASMRRGNRGSDPTVVGIVVGEPGVPFGADVTSIAIAAPRLHARLERAQADDDGDEQARIWLELERRFQRVYAPVVLSGTALCKVDAGHGAIQVGDLLTTSPTPGHAMRTDVPLPGTILGKALERLDAGTGPIRVLVMLR